MFFDKLILLPFGGLRAGVLRVPEIAGGNAREFGNLFGCRLAGIRGTAIFRYCPHFANGKKLTEEDGTNGTDGTNVRHLPGLWLR